jgi:hypothetical protein
METIFASPGMHVIEYMLLFACYCLHATVCMLLFACYCRNDELTFRSWMLFKMLEAHLLIVVQLWLLDGARVDQNGLWTKVQWTVGKSSSAVLLE